MVIQKLSSTDAFVVIDIPDAPSTGVVRAANKILQGGAADLARSASYTFATFELKRGGASAGINATGDATEAAIAAFVEELTPAAVEGLLHLDAAKGVSPSALAPLADAASRNQLGGSPTVTAAGVEAAAAWALGGLDGKTVAIEGGGPIATAVASALTSAGASIVEVPGVDDKPWMIWGAKADLIVAGSKAGTLTHQGAGFVKAQAIVPWGPIPVTAKAFANLRRAGVSVLPDFVTAGGGLLAGYLEGDEAAVSAQVAAKITAALDDAASHDDGVLLASCYRAEAFLASWTDHKLFGRPLAA